MHPRKRWRRLRRGASNLALVVVAIVAAGCSAARPAATATAAPGASPAQVQTISVGGVTRTYRIHIPATLDLRQPAPLVFVLHAAMGSAESTVSITAFDGVADAQGLIVVYPQGVDNVWNAGMLGCCGAAAGANVDDSGFIAAVLARVESRYRIDPARVAAVGVDNGAVLAYALACTMADRFTVVASVGGSMALDACHPLTPVSILEIHGTSDDRVPYGGGAWAASAATIPSAPAVTVAWAQLDGCPPAVTTTSGVVTTAAWSACADSTSVNLVTVQGGTHAWYGPGLGPVDGAIDATKVIATFLAAHPRAAR